jgi:FkbM family methyltransferase
MPNAFANRIKTLRAALRYDDKLHITDVGANPMNFEAPYKDLQENGDVVITGFDPQAETLVTLTEGRGEGDRYLPHAIGDGKAHTLNIYKGSGLTSLLSIRRPTLFYLMGLKRAAQLIETAEMETRRLDDLDDIQRIDLLKIDIQGAEKMVFENGKDKIATAVAVHSEINFFPLYEDQPSFGDIDVTLRNLGFVPHSFYHTVQRHVRSRYLGHVNDAKRTHLLDGDILYFRDLSRADDLTSDQLRKMALIADGVYGFTDYALRCMDELERRKDADEAAILAYVEAVNA